MSVESRQQPDERRVEDVRASRFRATPIEVRIVQIVRCQELRQAAIAARQRQVRSRARQRVRRLELGRAAEPTDELGLQRVVRRSPRVIPERDPRVTESTVRPQRRIGR